MRGREKAKVCVGAPPNGPVRWLLQHKDGRLSTVVAQTAFGAVAAAGWTFTECREIVRFEPEGHAEPIGPVREQPAPADTEPPAESSERATAAWLDGDADEPDLDLDVDGWSALGCEDWGGPVS